MSPVKLFLYNTETRQLEELALPPSGKIHMYTCGPTIYNYVHIGNLRTFVFEDLLRRTILYFGMPLVHVMNLTDVDDKTIKGALEKKISLKEFVEPYKIAFFEDLKALNVQSAEVYPAATEYIPEMIHMIEVLLEKGYAYQGKDLSIYFRIESFPSYGRLSHLSLDSLKAGASERVDADEYEKEHVADFVLWKAYDPARDGEIFWESPFGKGRPGWHIECSAMATKLLGHTIDIHVGGVDNIFPHHENEIAQSECCTGKRFVKHWLHSEHLLVNGKKMSKKLGNFYTLRDLLAKGYSGPEIRYLLLQAHYRTQLNFTLQGLEAAKHALRRLQDLMLRLSAITHSASSCCIEEEIKKARKAFKTALAEDLGIAQALAVIFDLVRDLNTLCDAGHLSQDDASKALSLFREFDQVLGCIPFGDSSQEIPFAVLELLEQRETARKEKKWSDADKYRDLILQQGYIIEDTKAGPKLKLK
jgi:cysteinyl-tRNA synthetase